LTANVLKARLAKSEKQLGCIVMLPSPDVAEIIAHAGVDMVMIDHEHGPGGLQNYIAQARAMQGGRTQAMVRVPKGDLVYAQRILDAGCRSIVFPGIDTADEAEAAVRACRYPPDGVRGAGGGIRAAKYGIDSGYYGQRSDDDLLIVAQIESVRAVENIDAICSVPGVDMLLIGPRDLSASMGLLDSFNDPAVWRLVAHAAERIRGARKFLASTLHPGMSSRDMFDAGYDLVLAKKDVDFVLEGATAMASL
jgi:4-hydroxy-2-oxoheptanedioate aldolase